MRSRADYQRVWEQDGITSRALSEKVAWWVRQSWRWSRWGIWGEGVTKVAHADGGSITYLHKGWSIMLP